MRGLRTTIATAILAAGAALAASQAAAADFNWRMQSNLNAGEPGYEAVRLGFAEVLGEMTGGRLKIEVFPVGALFPIKDGLEAVGNGIVEIGMATGGYYTGKMGPIAAIESGLPGAERSAMERYAFFYRKGFIDIARKAYGKYNIYYLGPNLSPSWDIISKVPIDSKKAFDGLKIRAFGIEANWYESMGASSVFLGGSEIYTALATGVVDAVRWGTPSALVKLSLHEVGKYYVMPSPMPAPNNNILVNQDAWNSLPDDIKHMMDMASRNAPLDYLARSAQEDAAAIATMKAAGVQISTVPAEEWAAMEGEVRKIWAAYAEKDELSATAVKMLQDYVKELGR